MSAYENVVGGKLRLKGKALNVRNGGLRKKKKQKERYILSCHDQLTDDVSSDPRNVDGSGDGNENGGVERLTPAERRYLERWQKIELERLANAAKKSHRQRIQEFNQYLANMTEHYDIPKVGPG